MDKNEFEKTSSYLSKKYQVKQPPQKYSFLDAKGLPYIEPEVTIEDSPRGDGWGQVLAGMGRLKRAKDLSSGERWVRLEWSECENFYAANALARKVVRLILDYGLLNGWRFSFEDKSKEETLKKEEDIDQKINKPLNVVEEALNAIEWGRLYGSAYLLGNFEDGRHPGEPLDYHNIKKIEWIRAITPFELYPLKLKYNISSNYLEPEKYIFSAYGGVVPEYSGLEVHASRIIRFNGTKLPRQLYVSNNYTHNSVLQAIFDVFQDYGLALEACGYAISEFSQGVYKMKGLAAMLQSGKEAKIIQRMQTVDAVRNLHRSIIMDADNESYDRVSGRFTGMSEIISKLEKQMVAVSNIPHNLLFSEAAGHAKASFSSGGDSEWGEWETTVHSFRKNYLTEGLTKLYSWLFLDKSNPITKGKLDKFKITYSGQRKLSEEKEVELYKEISATDRDNIDAGIITADEIRKTRYAQGGTFSDYSIRIELDDKAYEEAKLEKKKQEEMMAKQPVQPDENGNKQGQEGQNPPKDVSGKPAESLGKDKEKPEKKANSKIVDGIKFEIKEE